MPTHDRQLEIIAAAIADGIDPARISPAQYTRLSLKVRSIPEAIGDAIKAGTSKTITSLGVRVTKEKRAANEATCRACPGKKFRQMVQVTVNADGKESRGPMSPACDACNCSGKMLTSKWQNPFQECPEGYWTNRTKETPAVTGDASRGP